MTARFDLIGVDEEVVSEGLGFPFNFNLIFNKNCRYLNLLKIRIIL
jgi:hypothetical protein